MPKNKHCFTVAKMYLSYQHLFGKTNMTKKNSNAPEAKEPADWWADALAESDKLLNATTEDKKDSSDPPELKVTFVPKKK